MSKCSLYLSLELFLLLYFFFIVFSTITAFQQTQTGLLTAFNLFSLFTTLQTTFAQCVAYILEEEEEEESEEEDDFGSFGRR